MHSVGFTPGTEIAFLEGFTLCVRCRAVNYLLLLSRRQKGKQVASPFGSARAFVVAVQAADAGGPAHAVEHTLTSFVALLPRRRALCVPVGVG